VASLYLFFTRPGYTIDSGRERKGGGKMKLLFESLAKVIGLMMGSNFTVPCDEAMAFYRYPRFE
jgi:hypothetical protein